MSYHHRRHSPLIAQAAGSEPSSAAQDNEHDAFNALKAHSHQATA